MWLLNLATVQMLLQVPHETTRAIAIGDLIYNEVAGFALRVSD